MHAIPSSSDLSGMLSAKHRENSLKKDFPFRGVCRKRRKLPSHHPRQYVTKQDVSFSASGGCDVSPHNVTIPPMVVSSDSVPPDAASRIAARSCTSAAHVWHMVSLRRAGFSLRQIGRRSGRCMEGVRQALMRYEQALSELRDPASEEEGEELMMCGMFRDPEPLPPGHPVAMRGLWRGLEHWRDFV